MNSGQHKVKFEGLSRKSLPALSGAEGGGSILVTSNSFNTSGQLLSSTQSTIVGSVPSVLSVDFLYPLNPLKVLCIR